MGSRVPKISSIGLRGRAAITFSREIARPKKFAKIAENRAFFAENRSIFEIFQKIFRGRIKLIEIHNWSKFQLNWAIFKGFLAILVPNFCYFPYIKV